MTLNCQLHEVLLQVDKKAIVDTLLQIPSQGSQDSGVKHGSYGEWRLFVDGNKEVMRQSVVNLRAARGNNSPLVSQAVRLLNQVHKA